MFRRITVLSFISFIWLFSTGAAVCLANEEEDLYYTATKIHRLIDEGRFSQANSETDLMTIEFAGQAKVPEYLYWTAGKYKMVDRFQDAKPIYERIVRDFPESPWAGKSRFCIARADVMIFFMAGDYTVASESIDRLAVDFANEPDLPEALYWLTERFERVDRFEEAKQKYRRIAEDYPEHPFAEKAKICFARTEVKSLIVTGQYDQAKEALDKFIADFEGNPDLPEALFWITVRYEKLGRTEDAKKRYQQIIEQFPSYGKKAQLGIQRADVIALIKSQDYDGAKIALDKYIAGLTGIPPSSSNTDLPETLYYMAQRYKNLGRLEEENQIYKYIVETYPASIFAKITAEENKGILTTERAEATEVKNVSLNNEAEKAAIEFYQLARKYEESPEKIDLARQTYDRIVKEYPETLKAGSAAFDVRRLDILGALKAGDVNKVDSQLDDFIAAFRKEPQLHKVLFTVGREYSNLASKYENDGCDEQAKEYYKKATLVWEKVVTQLPPSRAYTAQACQVIAECCFEDTGEYEKAIELCLDIVTNWPDYEGGYYIQYLLGNYYERMAQAGLLSESEVNPLVEEAYETLVKKYPNCDKFQYASLKLAELNFEKGDWAKSAAYYELFLTKSPTGNRPARVLYSLGQAYENMRQTDKAVKIYNEFLTKVQPGDPRIEIVKQKLTKLSGSAKANGILSDRELNTIFGGYESGHAMCVQEPFTVGCKVSGSLAPCEYPNCSFIGECTCSDKGKYCRFVEFHSNCNPSSKSCPDNSCSQTYCYPSHIDRVCKTASTTGWCSGTMSNCN